VRAPKLDEFTGMEKVFAERTVTTREPFTAAQFAIPEEKKTVLPEVNPWAVLVITAAAALEALSTY
jgi:hypothetical protein